MSVEINLLPWALIDGHEKVASKQETKILGQPCPQSKHQKSRSVLITWKAIFLPVVVSNQSNYIFQAITLPGEMPEGKKSEWNHFAQ